MSFAAEVRARADLSIFRCRRCPHIGRRLAGGGGEQSQAQGCPLVAAGGCLAYLCDNSLRASRGGSRRAGGWLLREKPERASRRRRRQDG